VALHAPLWVAWAGPKMPDAAGMVEPDPRSVWGLDSFLEFFWCFRFFFFFFSAFCFCFCRFVAARLAFFEGRSRFGRRSGSATEGGVGAGRVVSGVEEAGGGAFGGSPIGAAPARGG